MAAMQPAGGAARHWLMNVCAIDSAKLALPADTANAAAWDAVAPLVGGEQQVASLVAAHFRLDVADLAARQDAVVKLLPEKVARQYTVLPLRVENAQLIVASADPVDFEAEEAIQFASGRRIRLEIAPPDRLVEAIAAAYGADDMVEYLLRSLDTAATPEVRVVEHGELAPVSEEATEHEPVVQLTNLIIAQAVKARASDIHIEPEQDGGRVRFRVDGVLETFLRLPLNALVRVVSRLKVLSNMDIADRMRPQDGRIRISIGPKAFDLRVSTIPTTAAEKCVMRISQSQETFALDKLDLLPREIEGIRALLRNSNGIVIITGPTGSGKTTTLYAALMDLATGEQNISTVEDPVEYQLPGLNQIQVDEKQGRTFAGALRALLRQDPDVILVGETRDLETAETSVRAAMTGHLVLTTLHTNDAIGAVPRLVDMGLDRAGIAATLRGIVAQRLVRKLCASCARPVTNVDELPERERVLARAFGVVPGRLATGCASCRGGFHGRIAIMEIATVSPALADAIGRGALANELQRIADDEGMVRLRESALERVRRGDTTLEEVERVLGAAAPVSEGGEAPGGVVLIIDDDHDSRLLMRAVLEHHGFTVLEEDDGEAGWTHLERQERISITLLDLHMPGHDPRAFLRMVRATPRTVGLPVIAVGTEENSAEEMELLDAGADDYVHLPLEPEVLTARVKAVLRRVRAVHE